MKPEALETWTNLNYPPPDERGCDNCLNLFNGSVHPQCDYMYHPDPMTKCVYDFNKELPSKWKWDRKI